MSQDTPPPAGYTVRRPSLDDLAATAAFLDVVTTAEYGVPTFPREELHTHWLGLELDNDAWLLFDPDGGIAGYAALHHQGHAVLQSEGYVHPARAGQGLGTFLVRTAEKHRK